MDYFKNLEANNFPNHFDLRIPVEECDQNRKSGGSVGSLEDALGGMMVNGGFGGNARGKQQQQQPAVLGRAGSLEKEDLYIPIMALNQYSTDWRIKARIIKKGDMRTWNNAKGQGNLFSIDMMDAEGTQIQATFFKESAD